MIASQIHVRMEVNALMALNLITVDVQLASVEKVVHSERIKTYYCKTLLVIKTSIGFIINPNQFF